MRVLQFKVMAGPMYCGKLSVNISSGKHCFTSARAALSGHFELPSSCEVLNARVAGYKQLHLVRILPQPPMHIPAFLLHQAM